MWDGYMEFFTKKYPYYNTHAILVSSAVTKRIKLGWSQKELAEKSEVSYRKIKRFENCYNIKLIDFIKIFVALDIDLIKE